MRAARRAAQRLRLLRPRVAPVPVPSPGPAAAPDRSVARARVTKAGDVQGVISMVGAPGRRRVVILAGPDAEDAVQTWLKRFHRDRVHLIGPQEILDSLTTRPRVVLTPAATDQEVVEALKRVPPPDIVVAADPGDDAAPYELFRSSFLFVRKGGAFLVDRTVARSGSPRDGGLRPWIGLLAATDDVEVRRELERLDKELVRAVGAVLLTPQTILVTKRLSHRLKLRHRDANEILAVREPALDVTTLGGRAGGTWASRASVHFYGHASSEEPWPAEIDYPAVQLRHYQGRIASSGGTLLFTGGSILPDSFRWHLTDDPQNSRLKPTSPDFARVKSSARPRRRMSGSFYHLDSHASGHFGHLTTEVLSRLWGWQEAKEQIPDLKAFWHWPQDKSGDPDVERELFTAFGIAEEDLVWARSPVWLESVVSATPMWHNEAPHYVHPDLVQTWQRLTAGLLGDRPWGDPPERIFVSRGADLPNRWCRNKDEVERFFADRGFQVVYPERLSLPEQARLFAGARVVAGFGGSAMFNLMHARRLETTIVLSHDAYTARNENLFASLIGGQLHYFWSPSDVAARDATRRRDSFMSSWAFDFDQHAATLDRVLRSA